MEAVLRDYVKDLGVVGRLEKVRLVHWALLSALELIVMLFMREGNTWRNDLWL